MKIMMFNGLFLFLLIMWTSAETEPETERTGGQQVYANESLMNIQDRKGQEQCEILSGKCIKNKKDCPSTLPFETEPGRPYCSKGHRCCYPELPGTERRNRPGGQAKPNRCVPLPSCNGKKYGPSVTATCIPRNEHCAGRDTHPFCKDNTNCHCCIQQPDLRKGCSKPTPACTALAGNAFCTLDTVTNKDNCLNNVKSRPNGALYRVGMCEDKRCACCVPINGPPACPYDRFEDNHVCDTCRDEQEAAAFSNRRTYEKHNTVFSNVNNRIAYQWTGNKNDPCILTNYVKTWDCVRNRLADPWTCSLTPGRECCKSKVTADFGHLHLPIDCKNANNC